MFANRLKRLFVGFLQSHSYFESKHVLMRFYDHNIDTEICNFSNEDWEKIFPHSDVSLLKKWTLYNDRVILSCFDNETLQLFGFIVITEFEQPRNQVFFDGGTWKNTVKSSLLVYEGLYRILAFLVENKFDIEVTCMKNNIRADLLQKHFGFVEYKTDDNLSYKYLDVSKFNSSDIPGHLELCFSHLSK